ncbi:MAG: SGNH/GDSL hydrolase family protein [Candidatus Methylacidiphilales bacterium]|nr:SGNH/GDSL hydrolase family protein [Candidatus Methylacidiphilales bacterium]
MKTRRPLKDTWRHLAQGRLTIGFLGGSITEENDINWPAPVTRWFATNFPNSLIVSENAAMGATGSDSACIRVQTEIIDKGCNVTFVEFAVNDWDTAIERRKRTREGLIRMLVAAGSEVVLVYTYRQEMYAEMMAGKMPETIAEFEELAEYYGISSVWVGLHALNEVRAGKMKWGEWLPDGLHPAHRGGWSYAEAVIGYLENELPALGSDSISESSPAVKEDERRAIPSPLSPFHWGNITLLPLDSVDTEGPWVLRRVHNRYHTGQVLESHSPGARIRFSFTGRGLALVFEYGKRSAEFAWRVDGGDWSYSLRNRPDWGGDCGMVGPFVVSDELPPGLHIFELELIHGNRSDCTGTELRLGLIGVLPAL